jgi:hypothetical protein
MKLYIHPNQKMAKFLMALVFTWSNWSVVSQDDVKYIDLLGDSLFPEGILALPDGRLLVGGFGDGSLQFVDPNGNTSNTYLSAPGENGMVIAVGFAHDASTNLLWVSNFNFNTSAGVPGSQLKVFNLSSSDLVATIPPDFINGAFFNEVAITDDGIVYVSDTFNPTIWFAPNMTSVEKFVTNDSLKNPVQPFGLNGLTISPDGQYLIASVMDRLDAGDGRLVRITLSSRAVLDIELQSSGETPTAFANFAGSDGMRFIDGSLYMVNVYSPAGAIYKAEFSDDYSVATLTILEAYQSVYNRPTASALVKNTYWTVQSQLDHIIDDENGALGTPPEIPFQIVGVPFDLLQIVTNATTSPGSVTTTSPVSSPVSAPPPITAPTVSLPDNMSPTKTTTEETSSVSKGWFNLYKNHCLVMISTIIFLVLGTV